MKDKMTKETASRVLTALDKTGNDVQDLIERGYLSKEAGSEILRIVDTTADKIQVAAYGQEAFDAYRRQQMAKVIKRDSDEKFMETFENPQKVIQSDADEPYMHKAPGGFNSKDVPTFDDDISSSVSNRDEFEVRDLSEHANKTTKQPSWPGGSSGKSTKQGSSKDKTWAP